MTPIKQVEKQIHDVLGLDAYIAVPTAVREAIITALVEQANDVLEKGTLLETILARTTRRALHACGHLMAKVHAREPWTETRCVTWVQGTGLGPASYENGLTFPA